MMNLNTLASLNEEEIATLIEGRDNTIALLRDILNKTTQRMNAYITLKDCDEDLNRLYKELDYVETGVMNNERWLEDKYTEDENGLTKGD